MNTRIERHSLTFDVRQAESIEEVDRALELIYKSFPIGYFASKRLKQNLRCFLPNDFAPDRFVLAIDNNQIIGAFRLTERQLVIGNELVSVIGTTDYCIDYDYQDTEGAVIGFDFYVKGCELIRKWPYPLVLGSARRVIANYYQWFGWTSCHTYNECKIESLNIKRPKVKDVDIKEQFIEENIDIYEAHRLSSLEGEWGYFLRSDGFWKSIGHLVSLNKYRFFEIIHGQKVCGFFITQGSNVLDYGINSGGYLLYATSMLFFLQDTFHENIVLKISEKNRLLSVLGLSHVQLFSRFVPDEGVMAMCLDKKKLVDLFCKVAENQREHIKKNNFKLNNRLVFSSNSNEKIKPVFNIDKITKKDEQILINSLFLGTMGPHSLLGKECSMIPPTMFRINELESI